MSMSLLEAKKIYTQSKLSLLSNFLSGKSPAYVVRENEGPQVWFGGKEPVSQS